MNHPIPVVTCTIYRGDKFLVIRRWDGAKKFGGHWGFPGGKVDPDETIAGALKREVFEETSLELEDKFLLIDSYYYEGSLGLHFAVYATSEDVHCLEGYEYRWLSSLDELQKLKRIPGIDYHIVKGTELLKQQGPFLSLKAVDYVPEKYIN
ncbi:MAG TPA: NUDIX domain-containing protein [Candidatus Saccharimonadales bacterium]|nr:NUDIX domain-containing protein [Candidatus Saccharimonadales bacterium]